MPDYPILEFDPSPTALMEPSRLIKPQDAPEHCVICFFREVINKVCEEQGAKQAAVSKSEAGLHPLHEIIVQGKRLAFFHPGIGAPLAAGLLEEFIAAGCRKFIACGGAGVLDRQIAVGHLLVPTSAVRDEGTSYHYMPPGREVAPSAEAVAAIEQTLAAHSYPYLLNKTWTTDAFYRETPDKIKRRRAEGCLTVEMEAAAFFAVAQFRGVKLAQILYGGDDVSGEEWDSRDWHTRASIREKVFWLAAEACLAM
jgi:uridine phosphorylase